MKKFKICAAMLVALMAVSFVMAFTFPAKQTKLLFRRTKTAQTIGTQSVDVAVFNILDNSVMHVQARIMAIELLSGKAKTWNIQGGFKRSNGILSLIANDIDIEFQAGDPITGQWAGSVEFNDVTDELCVRFKGSANSTIEWFVDFEMDLYQP